MVETHPSRPKRFRRLCNGFIKNMHNQDCDLNIDQLKGKVLFLMSSDLVSDLCQLGAEGARCYILMIITVQKNWVLNHAGVSFYFQPQQFPGRGQSDASCHCYSLWLFWAPTENRSLQDESYKCSENLL